MSFVKELIVRSIKMLDVLFIIILGFIFGFFPSIYVDKQVTKMFKSKNEDAKPIYRVFLELVFELWLISIVLYIAKNIIELIPFPLDNVHGFEHKRLDLTFWFVFIFMTYQVNFTKRVQYLYKRYTNT
jgi:H+/Cl- antiporter ClcA